MMHSLDPYSNGHRRSLAGSFLVAIALTASLFGILALISATYKLLADAPSASLEISVAFEEPLPPETQDSAPPKRVAFIKPPIPVPVRVIPTKAPLILTDFDPPTPDAMPDPHIDWEEPEWEDLFAEQSPETKPSKAKRKPQSHQKALKKEQRRETLAKKIVRKASVISRPKPIYPHSARRKKQEGRVVITVTVNPSGKVTSAYISKSSQVSALDSAALKAARKHRFRPAQNGQGLPVTTKTAIPFTFKLQNS